MWPGARGGTLILPEPPGPAAQAQTGTEASTRPPPVPAAGGPGRWSCSQTRPSPQTSTNYTETPWCSAHGTSRFWKEGRACVKWEPAGVSSQTLNPHRAEPQTSSGRGHGAPGEARWPGSAQVPLHSSPDPQPASRSPTVAQADPLPPGPPPGGLTGARGPSGYLSSSSPSCAPRWPEGAGERQREPGVSRL